MSNLINIFKKVSNKIIFSLVIISITSGVNFYATNTNELNNSDDTVLINHTTSDESKILSKKQDGFFSGMYQMFRNFFSIDERKIYKIIKNLENTTIKKEFEKYEKIHIKTSDDMIDYYEKTIRIWRAGDIITSMPFEYGLNFKHFGQSWCINKLPDNCGSLQKNIFSWISYSEWIKWYKNLHSMKEIKNDILEIYEDNEKYVDKIKIYKF